MMKLIRAIFFGSMLMAGAGFVSTAADAQFTSSPAPQTVGGPVASPTIVVQPDQGGILNLGQAFGNALAPYINSLVAALISTGLGWLFYLIKQKLGLDVDQKNRDAVQTFAQNMAASLIADGKVRLDGLTVHVDNAALLSAVNQAELVIPGALAHFNLTPDAVSAKIVDKIPQVPAGAQIIANAHAAAPAVLRPNVT